MIPFIPRFTLLSRAAAAAFLLLSACSCDGSGTAPGADAEPDALPDLDVEIAQINNGALSIELTPDGNSLVYCSGNVKIGFLDAHTLEPLDEQLLTELKPLHSDGAIFTCYMSVIGDYAYAYYGTDDGGGHAGVAKVSLADRSVVAFWWVPDDMVGARFITEPPVYQGVRPTADPTRAVLSYPGGFRRTLGGIELTFLDLETGAFSSEVLVEDTGVKNVDLYVVFGDYAFGQAFKESSSGSYTFLVSLSERKLLWRHKMLSSPQHVALDPSGERVAATQSPSDGWQMYSFPDGELLFDREYLAAGGGNFMLWATGDRLVHIADGSRDSWVTIFDDATFAPLTTAAHLGPDSWVHDYALSPDGTHLYTAMGFYIADVTLPPLP